MKPFPQILAAAAFAIAATAAQAIPLNDLLAGGSITAGDKVFDQWRLIYEDYSDAALTVDPANIEVTPLHDGDRDPGPGLRFDVLNGAFDVTGDGIFAYIDYMLGFRVTAPVKHPIKDNSLFLTDTQLENATDNLGAFIQEFVGTDPSLVEVPGDIGLPDLAVKEVEISELIGVGATNDLFDEAEFPPQTQIYVSQDIFVWATDPAETARLLGFEQRFSQVPVPSTLILLFGSVLFAGFAHRRLLG